MQSNKASTIEKIFTSFNKIDKLPKAIIKYGTQAFLLLFAVGTLLVVLNRTMFNFDYYREFIATSVVKASFTILAEAVIGGLIIDYVFKKN